MRKKRILIAYDGLSPFDDVLEDLRWAGLLDMDLIFLFKYATPHENFATSHQAYLRNPEHLTRLET